MVTVADVLPSVKGLRHQCVACAGLGRISWPSGDQVVCDRCDGFGSCRYVEPTPETASKYAVCSGQNLIDSDSDLPGLIDRLLRDWDRLTNEHLIVWMLPEDGSGHGPVVVARLYPSRTGKTAVQWL